MHNKDKRPQEMPEHPDPSEVIRFGDVTVTRQDFVDYVRVQQEGRYNMYCKLALTLTELDEKVYHAILKHYGQIQGHFKL